MVPEVDAFFGWSRNYMKKLRFGVSILILTLATAIGLGLVGVFDERISGRETFFKVIIVLVLGALVYAISTVVRNGPQR